MLLLLYSKAALRYPSCASPKYHAVWPNIDASLTSDATRFRQRIFLLDSHYSESTSESAMQAFAEFQDKCMSEVEINREVGS